jgi:hypothetical protein
VGRTLLSDAFAIGVLAPFLCWIEKERIAAQVNLCHSDRSFAFPQGKGSAVEEPAVPDRTPEDRRRRPLPSQTRLPEWIAPCSFELEKVHVGTAALGCPRAEGPTVLAVAVRVAVPFCVLDQEGSNSSSTKTLSFRPKLRFPAGKGKRSGGTCCS